METRPRPASGADGPLALALARSRPTRARTHSARARRHFCTDTLGVIYIYTTLLALFIKSTVSQPSPWKKSTLPSTGPRHPARAPVGTRRHTAVTPGTLRMLRPNYGADHDLHSKAERSAVVADLTAPYNNLDLRDGGNERRRRCSDGLRR